MDFIQIVRKIARENRHVQTVRNAMKKPDRITVVAHRGGPGMGSHENTMKAFEKAIECGADMIETDIRRTQDGVIVCHHDRGINGKNLSDLTFTEANRLARAKGYDIPLLRNLLSLAQGKIQLDIELKEVGYELDVVDQLRDVLKHEDFVMKSFNDSSVFAIKEIDPRITTGLLVEKSPFGSTPLDAAAQLSYEARLALTKADFLGPESSLVNRALVARMRFLGKKIFVWTPNSDAEIESMIALGVDAIITDKPNRAIELLGR